MGWNKTNWNDLMKLRWEITEAPFLHVRGKLFEEPQNGKNLTKQEYKFWNPNKMEEVEQNWKAIEKRITKNSGVSEKISEKCKREEWKKKVKLMR